MVPTSRYRSPIPSLTALAFILLSLVAFAHCGLWPDFPDRPSRDAAIDAIDAADVVGDASDGGSRRDGGMDAMDASDANPACIAAPPGGPFTPEMVFPGANGRDLAFDGRGRLYTGGPRIVAIDSMGTRSDYSTSDVYGIGLRFLPSGELAVTSAAVGVESALRIVGTDGTIRIAGSGYGLPSGLAVHPRGDVYFSDTSANTIYRLDGASGMITPVSMDVATPTGVVFSPDYARLYVGSPSRSAIYYFDVADDGSLGRAQPYVSGLFSANGLAFDRCGYLYVSDRDRGRVLRVPPGGGSFIEITTPGTSFTPWGLAFGRGNGFESNALYAVDSASGAIYRLNVGVEGAPIVAPR